jgi:hypothetical protein
VATKLEKRERSKDGREICKKEVRRDIKGLREEIVWLLSDLGLD